MNPSFQYFGDSPRLKTADPSAWVKLGHVLWNKEPGEDPTKRTGTDEDPMMGQVRNRSTVGMTESHQEGSHAIY